MLVLPAAHGANRTDGCSRIVAASGFIALHGGFNQPTFERADDGLQLIDCLITAVCHCAPPDNKPLPAEIANCSPWLSETIDLVQPRVLLALGQIAWEGVIDECRRRQWYAGSVPKFGHGAKVALADGKWLLGSYHPSQQNTFTGKLTEPMFDSVFAEARKLVS